MEIGKVHISNVYAQAVYCKTIPKGVVGASVVLEYGDKLWDGLIKKVVFTNGIRTVELVNPGGLATLPPEVVDTVGREVRIGVCGVDAGKNLVIPTLWASLGIVREAVPTVADEAGEDTLPVWAQAMAMIGDPNDLDTDNKKNLVAAVNELKEKKLDAEKLPEAVGTIVGAELTETLGIINLYVCSDGEYTEDGTPAIEEPEGNTAYLVPQDSEGILYASWVYANGAWEFDEMLTVTLDETEDGKNGYTPQKGIDYYTEVDKQEMVNAVIAALPVYGGEVAEV